MYTMCFCMSDTTKFEELKITPKLGLTITVIIKIKP